MAFIIPQTWEQALQSKEKGESREQTVDIVQYWIYVYTVTIMIIFSGKIIYSAGKKIFLFVEFSSLCSLLAPIQKVYTL